MCKSLIFLVVFAGFCWKETISLNNGLARTPPMGWVGIGRFWCNRDCLKDPEYCMSDLLYTNISGALHSFGFIDVGYKYVLIGDCWMEKERDAKGNLVVSKSVFSGGLSGVAGYFHSIGLKLGLYIGLGARSRNGYPGLQGHEGQDIGAILSWGVDFLYVDGYGVDTKLIDTGFETVGNLLKSHSKPVLYSCVWPEYELEHNIQPNYALIAHTCNMFRSTKIPHLSWNGVLNISNFYEKDKYDVDKVARPGQWNDPYFLFNLQGLLSRTEFETQMALWAMLAAPLFITDDIRYNDPYRGIALKPGILTINQDSIGNEATLVYQIKGHIDVWHRLLINGDHAVLILNRMETGLAYAFTDTLLHMGVNLQPAYQVHEILRDRNLGQTFVTDPLTFNINPTGAVLLRCKSEH